MRNKYGGQFEAIVNDVKQTDDLRVLDYNGHNVFYNFSFQGDGPSHHPRIGTWLFMGESGAACPKGAAPLFLRP